MGLLLILNFDISKGIAPMLGINSAFVDLTISLLLEITKKTLFGSLMSLILHINLNMFSCSNSATHTSVFFEGSLC